jgi:hypothetical protein
MLQNKRVVHENHSHSCGWWGSATILVISINFRKIFEEFIIFPYCWPREFIMRRMQANKQKI